MASADLQKPPWIRVRMPTGQNIDRVRGTVRGHGLHTVCDSSRCPNLAECWGRGTATFMILGSICTRSCRFCAVSSGDPGGIVDKDEPTRVAQAVRDLGLKHVVITSVARDDLEDGGASAFASTVRELRKSSPGTRVELLIPDLQGDACALRTIMEAKPNVLGHNLEVVERLQVLARDAKASYARSLSVLETAKRMDAQVLTKSSLMLGLGEEGEEVRAALKDLRRARVDIVTFGQYLKPKGKMLEVKRYLTPEEFAQLREEAMGLGFSQVVAGPLVRSSYRAEEAYDALHGG